MWLARKDKFRTAAEADLSSRRLVSEVVVGNASLGLYKRAKGLWDTGAKMSTASASLIAELGLAADPDMSVKVNTTSGARLSRVYRMAFVFGDQEIAVPVLESGTIDIDVLIGMDVITRGDLSITNAHGRTEMIFRIPPRGHIGK